MDFDEYKKRREELFEEPVTPDDVYVPPEPYKEKDPYNNSVN